MRTAIFLYKQEHVGLLPALIEKVPQGTGYDIIACDLGIEFLLEKSNIAFISARSLRTLSPSDILLTVKNLGIDIMQSLAFSFFSYRDISLGKLFTPSLQYYLMNFLYYFDVIISALEQSYTNVVLVDPTDSEVPAAGAVLEKFNNRAFLDAMRIVCDKKNISVEVVKENLPTYNRRATINKFVFTMQRTLFGVVIKTLNFYVRVMVPKKQIRVLATEYWKNLSPLINKLPEGELVLLDRAESRVIGLRTIIRNRIQFMHAADFNGMSAKKNARRKAAEFKNSFQSALSKHDILQRALFRGYPFYPVVMPVLEAIFDAAERVVLDIDGTWAMIQHLQPQVVIVRASISAQTHFAVLCEIARLNNIPSIEVQHGVFSMGDETLTTDHAAEYIAEYGPHERELWSKYAYAPRSTPIDIGSPRFDKYISKNATQSPAQDGTFKILHIATVMTPGSWNDSYDVDDFFKTMADAVRDIPNVHVTIKLRASRVNEDVFFEIIKRRFGNIPHRVVQFEPLLDLLPKMDAVVSCHSTAVLEALLTHRPVLLDASLPIYKKLVPIDYEAHIAAGAVLAPQSVGELAHDLQRLAASPAERKALSLRAEEFMRENYVLYDGKASDRLADFIRSKVSIN